MARKLRMTEETLHVLLALLRNSRSPRYGLELARQAGLKSGTIYPVMTRLERRGLVESAWESVDPAEVGRPARRYYVLTPRGEDEARALRSRLREMVQSDDDVASITGTTLETSGFEGNDRSAPASAVRRTP